MLPRSLGFGEVSARCNCILLGHEEAALPSWQVNASVKARYPISGAQRSALMRMGRGPRGALACFQLASLD